MRRIVRSDRRLCLARWSVSSQSGPVLHIILDVIPGRTKTTRRQTRHFTRCESGRREGQGSRRNLIDYRCRGTETDHHTQAAKSAWAVSGQSTVSRPGRSSCKTKKRGTRGRFQAWRKTRRTSGYFAVVRSWRHAVANTG